MPDVMCEWGNGVQVECTNSVSASFVVLNYFVQTLFNSTAARKTTVFDIMFENRKEEATRNEWRGDAIKTITFDEFTCQIVGGRVYK